MCGGFAPTSPSVPGVTAETPGSPPVPPPGCTLLAEGVEVGPRGFLVGHSAWGPGPLGGCRGMLLGYSGRRASGRAGERPPVPLTGDLRCPPAPLQAGLSGQTQTPDPAPTPTGPPPFATQLRAPVLPCTPSCPPRPTVAGEDGESGLARNAPLCGLEDRPPAVGVEGPRSTGQGLHTAPWWGPRRGPGAPTHPWLCRPRWVIDVAVLGVNKTLRANG